MNGTNERPPRDWDLVRAAMALAIEANKVEVRKGTDIPYLSHLLAVTAIVYEHGGTDEQVAAALLHDVAEDQGGEAMLGRIDALFPDHPRVAGMVRDLSDAIVEDKTDKPPWRQRKVAYLDHLRHTDVDALLVSAADKLHNSTAILDDYRRIDEELWDRFNSDRAEALWYYQSLARILAERMPDPLTDKLTRTVAELVALVRAQVPDIDREVDQVRNEIEHGRIRS